MADRAEDPGIHAEHLVGIFNRQRVVGDTQHCATFLGELVEQFEQLCGVFTVERAAGLVSEQHGSGARDSPGDTHPLPFPTGDFGGEPALGVVPVFPWVSPIDRPW